VFLLKNYHADELMPQAIYCENFANGIGVNLDEITSYSPIKVTELPSWVMAGNGLCLDGWNRVELDISVRKMFPFLVGQMDSDATP
jgi:hypothetical protein